MRPVRAAHLIVLTTFLGCMQGQHAGATGPSQARVESLAGQFLAGEISRIEILHTPARILTRSRITPEMLEKCFYYKVTVREPASGAYRDQLLRALGTLAVRPETEMKDIRWGVVFYGRSGVQVGALYFDASGSYGAVEGRPVSFKGDLFKWLDSNFATCLR